MQYVERDASVAACSEARNAVQVSLWSRIVGRIRRAEIEKEIEEERMTPEERRLATEGVENLAADREAEGHLGAINPERLEEE
jgi:hypothetical protein